MNALTWVHIGGGALALAAGTVAIATRKGGATHVSAGLGFVAAMLVLGVTASILGPSATPVQSPVGGVLVYYFVATGWLAARRRDGVPRAFEKTACVFALALAALVAVGGVQRALAPPGQFTEPPSAAALFILSAVCLLAAVGDLRFVLRGRLARAQRIARHVWRICFAFFIATGSFFLGQMDVLPPALRVMPALLALAFAPLALMAFWLLRVRFAGAPPSRP